MTPRPRFITLEGGEGAGKSTQTRLLAEALCALGVPVLRTREPGGARGAERLRALLLSGEITWSPRAETLLHFAARAEHVARTIRPALDAGMWVVCDRFYDSTMAYQGSGQGADPAFIQAQIGLLGIRPDLTLMLDASPTVASERLRRRGGGLDRYEREDPAFHARTSEAFLRIARAEPGRCRIVPADGDPATVHRMILTVVTGDDELPPSRP